MERMSAWRAMVRSPPSTGALESDFPPPPSPLPHAARTIVATAAIPVNLSRMVRVIECLMVLSRRSGTEVARVDRWRLAGAGGTAGHPDAATVAFITGPAKYFFS